MSYTNRDFEVFAKQKRRNTAKSTIYRIKNLFFAHQHFVKTKNI
ncbi:hypothetical protein M23134_04765 [Microscilla marina ATCC 23134]|uniref:Uncharacterized protein n=1 Tax=Microscilla marina ATCC 23134 TaxID=313606 RepID=A1ZRI7_MICM2|nr:hypothetical protein M23134_04765 [Microscilla marina ATCC 23134]